MKMTKSKENPLRDKMERLSILARETQGASFVIQHDKGKGKFKVVFNNFSSCRDYLKETDIEEAVDQAIEYLTNNRRSMDVPEKYTLF